MSPTSTITSLPSHHPPNYTTDHHVNSPPTSFRNPWPSYRRTSPLQLARSRFFGDKNFVPVPSDRSTLVHVRKPDFGTQREGLKATWIGHASFIVETTKHSGAERGVRIAIDPVWSDRVGPYGVVGPVRFTPPPCPLEEVPHIDAVVISHDHYDHLDSNTLKMLNAQQNGELRILCALGVKSVIVGLGVGIKDEQVTEMDWWDIVELGIQNVGKAKLVCTPAQHRSGRSPLSFDSTLWCSWVIQEQDGQTQGKRLYFAGDTGYCYVSSNSEMSHHSAPHPPCPGFAQIGELYGPFDLSLLPIGCYRPRELLSGQHSSPDDSIAIHKDVKSKKSIGMHYGVFRGGVSSQFEPVTEPPERWKSTAEKEGLEWGVDVGLCDVGETVVV